VAAEPEASRQTTQLASSEALFQGLLDSAPDPIVIVDDRGRIVLVNRQAEETFGYTRDELRGQVQDILLPERFREAHVGHRAGYVAAPRTRPMGMGLELYARCKDGRELPVEISLSPLHTERGLLVTSVIRDVSERTELLRREQEARNAAEAEQRRLQALLAAVPDAIIAVDAVTGRLEQNTRAVEIFGPLDPARGHEQRVGLVLRPDGQRLELEELLTSRALRGESIDSEELVVLQPHGQPLPVLGRAAPVRAPDGEVTGAVVSYQDISVLKELERLREEWTSAIAHDLRQPVAAVAAHAQLLQALGAARDAGETEQQAVEHILASARQLYRMISDLLDSSLLSAGRLKLEPLMVDLPTLLRAAVGRMAETLGDHPVQFVVAGAIPRISADPGRLEQVVGNLITNAAKYGTPGTPIQTSITVHDENVEIAVVNEGSDLSHEEIGQLFRRFYRSSRARNTGAGGLGLGLYICRELVRAHGGRIWAESAAGTVTFRFTLPLAAPSA
jgi:PAS domain S-box-containing protein